MAIEYEGSCLCGLETQLEQEALFIVASGQTADFRNGVAALLARRPPVFEGR
jgi:enoyl-CoA hydratase/carnithine racemase